MNENIEQQIEKLHACHNDLMAGFGKIIVGQKEPYILQLNGTNGQKQFKNEEMRNKKDLELEQKRQ